MFTGLIQGLGKIVKISPYEGGQKIAVEWENFAHRKILPGASVAVDGVCLSAERIDGNIAVFTAVEETISRTTLKFLKSGDKVNLELPLTPESFLDGHLVSGHIDCIGKIAEFKKIGAQHTLRVEYPEKYRKFLVEKGSVAVDGISLTVVEVGKNWFSCAIIPETMARTTLGFKKPGDYVNLEFDIIAKYVWRQLAAFNDRDESHLNFDDLTALY